MVAALRKSERDKVAAIRNQKEEYLSMKERYKLKKHQMYKYMYDNLKHKIRVNCRICRKRSKNASIGDSSIVSLQPLQPQKSCTIIPMTPTIISIRNIRLISHISPAFTHKLAILTRISSFHSFGILNPDHRLRI